MRTEPALGVVGAFGAKPTPIRTQRQAVDYSLRKRALLREVYSGRVGTYEVCDASPYLKNAARFHGEPTDLRCPICRRENLTYVHYIYGDELKQSAGQARTRAELAVVAMNLREFQVFVVEVCVGCDWNHLIEQFLLGRDGLAIGDGEPASGPAAPPGGAGVAAGGPPDGAAPSGGSAYLGASTSRRRREARR